MATPVNITPASLNGFLDRVINQREEKSSFWDSSCGTNCVVCIGGGGDSTMGVIALIAGAVIVGSGVGAAVDQKDKLDEAKKSENESASLQNREIVLVSDIGKRLDQQLSPEAQNDLRQLATAQNKLDRNEVQKHRWYLTATLTFIVGVAALIIGGCATLPGFMLLGLAAIVAGLAIGFVTLLRHDRVDEKLWTEFCNAGNLDIATNLKETIDSSSVTTTKLDFTGYGLEESRA